MPSDTGRVDVPPEILKSSVRFRKEYILVAGDQVEVAVWRVPEASRVVTVRPDGMISLPLLQDVNAAGLTPRELAQEVQAGLSSRLLNPEVAVIPMQVRQPTVYVLGDVKMPGAQLLRNAVSVTQALALAGGTLRSGDAWDVAIIRLSGDGYLEAIPMIAPAGAQVVPFMHMAAVPLLPDDIIFVPESGRSQVLRVLSDLLVPFQIYLNYKLIESIV